MTAEDELKDEVGKLVSGTGPRPAGLASMGVMGPETDQERIAALEGDIARLYQGLLLAGRQIEDLRNKIIGS